MKKNTTTKEDAMAVSKLMHRWADDSDQYSRQVACGNRRAYAANGTSDPAKVTCPRCLAVAAKKEG